jgi:D-erythronate 2-dehydrogenase
MRILVTGSEGYLGARLIRHLRSDKRTTEIRGFDRERGHDLSDKAQVAAALNGVDRIFHTAVVAGAEAEADWPAALDANIVGTATLIAEAAKLPAPPVFVFASAIAVYGPATDGVVDDATPATGTGAYASAKRAIEILLADAARAGKIDVRSVRLPTTLVRPSRKGPTTAGFMSDLIVAYSAGRDFTIPVDPDTPFAVAALSRSLRALRVAADAPAEAFGVERFVGLPTVRITPNDAIAAVERVFGKRPGKIAVDPKPAIAAIAARWPRQVLSARGSALGLDPDETVEDMVRRYRDDPEGLSA